MTTIASNHIGQYLLSHVHGGYGIDLHGAIYFVGGDLVKSLVAGDDSCTVNEDVDIAAFFNCLLVSSIDYVIICNVNYVTFDIAESAEFLACIFYCCNIYVPDDEGSCPARQGLCS